MKRKILIMILLPLLMLSFLSVGYSQTISDTSIISMTGADWSLKVDSALASSIDSRNTPYMTAKSSTEKELFLELATFEDCKSGVVQFKVDMVGLTAYKQLPLTQEEIDSGSFRPKNVENSFALFDDGGRKVAHIYGSKIIDSKGVEVWLDQDLSEGLLTVYLPKPEELAALSFPLLLDPTFGYTNVGASNIACNSYIRGSEITVFDTAYVNEFWFYMYCSSSGVPATWRLGVFNETSNTWLYESSNITTQFTGWYRDIVDLTLTPGTYLLCLMGNVSNSYSAYDSTLIRSVYTAYSNWTFPTPTIDASTRSYSIFLQETTLPTATPTPTTTPLPEDMSNTDWWISILVLLLIIINIFLMMLPFALVRFTFGILSLFLCMLALSYGIPLSPYLQTAGLLISALAMLFSVRARE